MAGRRLAQASISTVGVWLLCALGLQGIETELPSAPTELPGGAACLSRFTSGVPAFVLDTDASVSNGATFLGSPPVRRGWDCVRACCTTQNCNLALVELQPDGDEDAISSCFLMNCLYEHNFVCKFARKEGFINYLTQDLYRSYRELRTRGFGGEEGCRPEGVGRLWRLGEENNKKELGRSALYPLPLKWAIFSKQWAGGGRGMASQGPGSGSRTWMFRVDYRWAEDLARAVPMRE